MDPLLGDGKHQGEDMGPGDFGAQRAFPPPARRRDEQSETQAEGDSQSNILHVLLSRDPERRDERGEVRGGDERERRRPCRGNRRQGAVGHRQVLPPRHRVERTHLRSRLRALGQRNEHPQGPALHVVGGPRVLGQSRGPRDPDAGREFPGGGRRLRHVRPRGDALLVRRLRLLRGPLRRRLPSAVESAAGTSAPTIETLLLRLRPVPGPPERGAGRGQRPPLLRSAVGAVRRGRHRVRLLHALRAPRVQDLPLRVLRGDAAQHPFLLQAPSGRGRRGGCGHPPPALLLLPQDRLGLHIPDELAVRQHAVRLRHPGEPAVRAFAAVAGRRRRGFLRRVGRRLLRLLRLPPTARFLRVTSPRILKNLYDRRTGLALILIPLPHFFYL